MLEKIKTEQLAKATKFVASYDINQLMKTMGSYYKTNSYINYAIGKMEKEGNQIRNSKMLKRQKKFQKYLALVNQHNLSISDEVEIMKICKISKTECLLFCYYLLAIKN